MYIFKGVSLCIFGKGVTVNQEKHLKVVSRPEVPGQIGEILAALEQLYEAAHHDFGCPQQLAALFCQTPLHVSMFVQLNNFLLFFLSIPDTLRTKHGMH